jgi:hypothetical protein
MTSLDRSTDVDVGFGYAMDPTTARRQFTLSVGVVIGLAMAIAAAAVNMPKQSVQSPGFYTVSIPSATMQAEREKISTARS